MTAEQLRNSILQEAISGRLVPQDPNDEPASALLARIREERECLFKAGKIKKKDYHIYDISDEEIPFELPQGWAWEKLGNLTKIISDGTHKTPHYVESGIPFLSVQNISGGQLDLSKIKYITQAEHEELIKRVKPQKGDLLICRIGTLGKAIKIYWDFEFSIFVSLGLIRLVDSSLADYISLIINSPIGNSWIQENKVGGGTHTFKINLGDIPNMMLPLPPLAEQKRIVAKLEELLPIVEQYGKAQKELDELNAALPARLRQSILQEAILGRLVPHIANDGNVDTLLDEVGRIKEQMLLRKEIKKGSLVSIPIEDEEIEYSIPDSWRFVRLQDICTCIFSGKSPKYSQTPTKHKIIGQQSNQWTGVEMRYVKYGTDEYAKDIPQIQYLQDHDVLLNTLGNGTLGRSGIYYSSYSDTPVLTDGHIFVLRTPHEVTAKYILAYLRVKFVDINRSADGSTNQTFLNLSKTSKWIIPLPPLAEQQRIVAKIEELFTQIDKITK